ILDDAALLDRIRYVLAHGVKEGLVRSCDNWPGLTSLAQMKDGKPRRFQWFNWTRRSSGNALQQPRPRFDPRWAEDEHLPLTEIPVAGLETREKLSRFLEETTRAIEAQAARMFRTVSGRKAVLEEHPHRRARRPKRQARPWCHTTVAEFRRQFLERFRVFAEAFRRASSRWRIGDFGSAFPEHAIRPFYWPGAVAGHIAAWGWESASDSPRRVSPNNNVAPGRAQRSLTCEVETGPCASIEGPGLCGQPAWA